MKGEGVRVTTFDEVVESSMSSSITMGHWTSKGLSFQSQNVTPFKAQYDSVITSNSVKAIPCTGRATN
jgi:hypothetical protein